MPARVSGSGASERLKDSGFVFRSGLTKLEASLTIPPGPVLGGVVPLHPSNDPSRDQVLFRHLARALPRLGVAVLRYDRRPTHAGSDVPLRDQARDALAAISALKQRVGNPELPVGLWGWSQGAWAATVASAESELVRFLILIASTGVSPAVQMRYGTAEHLRAAGFGKEDQAELLELRLAYEGAIRGTVSRSDAQELVDRYVSRPWFALAYVPRKLPTKPSWDDMDFDPALTFQKIVVPTVLFYGDTDEWSPIDESIDSWMAAKRVSRNQEITVVRNPGTSHAPTLEGKMTAQSISPDYTQAMLAWLQALLPRLPPGPDNLPRTAK
jgi:pimeloyl-ACP methyl ester carboxylesterase